MASDYSAYETLFTQLVFEVLCAEYEVETENSIFTAPMLESIHAHSSFTNVEPLSSLTLYSDGYTYLGVNTLIDDETPERATIPLSWAYDDIDRAFYSHINRLVEKRCGAEYDEFIELVFQDNENAEAFQAFIDTTGIGFDKWSGQMLVKTLAFNRQALLLQKRIVASGLFPLSDTFSVVPQLPDLQEMLNQQCIDILTETIEKPLTALIKEFGFFK